MDAIDFTIGGRNNERGLIWPNPAKQTIVSLAGSCDHSCHRSTPHEQHDARARVERRWILLIFAGQGVAKLSLQTERTGSDGSADSPTSSSRDRLPQDVNVNSKAPEPLPTDRPVGKSDAQNAAAQNAAAQRDVREWQDRGYEDIRVDQQQVNANRERVGFNRPDLQGTDPGGTRHYKEYERSSSNRGPAHQERIEANDPDAIVELEEID